MRVLLGITGSVATTLTGKIVKHLQGRGHEVKIVATAKADYFLQREPEVETLWEQNEFPLGQWVYTEGDPVPHKELADWGDVLLICPCTANTMGKISSGVADNLLTTVARIWNPSKPAYIAPAMNTQMFHNRVTGKTINGLFDLGFQILWPSVRMLACGEFGIGALVDIQTIGPIIEGYRWGSPLRINSFIAGLLHLKVPTCGHPGGFGVPRKHYIHPGVDLYNHNCDFDPNGDMGVYSMGEGEVVDISTFTGAHDTPPSPWWNDTWHVTVHDKALDLNILYGELTPNPDLSVGDWVGAGHWIGTVKGVLKHTPKDPPYHHSREMLHLELMPSGTTFTAPWGLGEPRGRDILDPTGMLGLIPDIKMIAGYKGNLWG